jgi:hypothetical protein
LFWRRKPVAKAYAEQRSRLDAEGTHDAFISPFDVLRDSRGGELSYCT